MIRFTLQSLCNLGTARLDHGSRLDPGAQPHWICVTSHNQIDL